MERVGVIALIVSVMFSHLFFIPGLRYSFQLTEFIFLILSLYGVMKHKFDYTLVLHDKWKLPFILLIFTAVLNTMVHFNMTVITANLGLVYLCCLSLLVMAYLPPNKTDIEKILQNVGNIGFYLLNVIVYGGLAWYFITGSQKMVLVYPNYPYFGDVVRIHGFNFSPNLMISVFAFFIGIKAAFGKYDIRDYLLTVLVAVISLTKEGMLLIVLATCLYLWKKYEVRKFSTLALVIVGLVYVLVSQFVFSLQDHPVDFKNAFAVNSDVKYSLGFVTAYPTTYFYLFQSGWILFKEHIVFGIGNGNFMQTLSTLPSYPASMPIGLPQDIYLGVASQLGILYLIYLFFQLRNMRTILHALPKKYFPLSLIGLYFLLESLSNGSMHFRHYFIFMGLCVALYYRQLYLIEKDVQPEHRP